MTRILSKHDFLGRFTTSELSKIYDLSSTQVAIVIWVELINHAESINLDYPPIKNALVWMESMGIVEVGRNAEILA